MPGFVNARTLGQTLVLRTFFGLAVKTGSIALQKFFFLIFFFCGKKFVLWGQNIFFQIRLKKQMGHPGLLFLIFWQVLE